LAAGFLAAGFLAAGFLAAGFFAAGLALGAAAFLALGAAAFLGPAFLAGAAFLAGLAAFFCGERGERERGRLGEVESSAENRRRGIYRPMRCREAAPARMGGLGMTK
jgi:membrane protein implicated in regulation of membrane protease activity